MLSYWPLVVRMSNMPVTYDDILAACRKLNGKTLRTLAGRATFRVEIEGSNLYVVPTSTGKRRLLSTGSRKAIDRYNESGSLTPSHYQDLTFNSVYVLRLISLVKTGG